MQARPGLLSWLSSIRYAPSTSIALARAKPSNLEIPTLGRYDREAFDEQSDEGRQCISTQLGHLQGECERARRPQVFLAVPWTRLCCRLQGASSRQAQMDGADALLQKNRSCKGYTSTVANRWLVTFWPRITARISSRPSARRPARPSCTPRREGKPC